MACASRLVLENVPKVAFFDGTRCPEDFPFPSCMRALLEYFGEDYGCRHASPSASAWRLGCPYAHMVGVTGNAFFLSWKPGWHGDNVAIHYMSPDPAAPYRRGFEAIGYGYEFVHREDGRDNEAFFRQRIIGSLQAGRPVLAFGVIGPPEPSIVTGYDDGGEVLIGWSFFQGGGKPAAGLEFEPCGYFRKRNWFPETAGLALVGEKGERPPLKEVYRSALQWGLQVMRIPRQACGDRRIGLAAYTAWADHLLRDEDFDTDDLAVLRERHAVHDDAVGTVAEARWYGALFLSHAAQQMSGIGVSEALFAASACYAAEHDLMWKVWALCGGLGRSDEHVRRFADPEARRQMAPLVLESREKDRQASEHIERALAAV